MTGWVFAGKTTTIAPIEFKLLRFFLDNPGRVVARDELFSDVWGLRAFSVLL